MDQTSTLTIGEQRQRVVIDLADIESTGRSAVPEMFEQRTAILGCRSAFQFDNPAQCGDGWCRIYRLSDRLHVATTEQRLLKAHRIRIYGDGLVTIRIVLAGNVRWHMDGLGTFDLPAPKVTIFEQALNSCMETELFAGLLQRVVTLVACPDYLRSEFGWSLEAAGGVPQFLALTPQVERLARELLENPHAGPRHGSFVQAHALELLCALAAEWETAPSLAQMHDRLTARDAEKIRQVRGELADSYHRPPPIAQLARGAGMNKAKLMRGFKQMFGETIADHCRRLRLDEARALLSSERISIGEVAAAVGYQHQSSFTAAFSAHFGFPPKAVLLTPRKVPQAGVN